MTLSVVIVNYNVKFFLEQCLISVFKSMRGIEGEVFVVDNASADGSCQMVKERFSTVELIENSENFGFSYANNQALRLAKGEFILVLNPDTVLEENTFTKCIAFMRQHPEAGGLSVKMIDGKGNFLPESKRALPSPMVSFYKIFGFSKLFPRSKTFARYHLGHLCEDQTHEIDILPGAFMFIRREALERVGLFDESFFMYGEDIDLSHRITQGGYKNFYYPETTIIHYKGESTKKGSINYVLVFYKAMVIFARKHFNQKNAFLYILLIYIAIYFRAGLSITKRILSEWLQPAIDAAVIAAGFLIIVPFWERVRFNISDVYPEDLVFTLSALYIFIWLFSIWLTGGYDKPKKLFAATKGMALGSLAILLIYALLPETMRFSRAIILITAFWSILLVQAAHFGMGLIRNDLSKALRKNKRIVIVGNSSEVKRVLDILRGATVDWYMVGQISPTNTTTHNEQMGIISQLPEIIRVNSVDEIIFCSRDISSQEIIKTMLALVSVGVDFKIAPPDSISVIGSNSIDTSGDLYTIEISAITKSSNRRFKRFFDITVAFFSIVLAPILYPLLKNFRVMVSKSVGVLCGQYTWVGYDEGSDFKGLPKIRRGVFSPFPADRWADIDETQSERINIQYAKNYSIFFDLYVVWSNLTQ